MSRTYIGPFGRILPVPEDSEPERLQLPIDETRTNMTTYQLPPPERLQFGSDTTTPGFTEPLRYNTISQSRRTLESDNTMYPERQGPSHREHLPPLSQLLTPASQSSAPPSSYSQEAGPNTPEWTHSITPGQRVPVPAQNSHNLPYHYPPTSHPQSQQLPVQGQPMMNSNIRRDDYQTSPSAQHFPSSYPSHQGQAVPLYSPYSGSAHHPLYTRQAQHISPPSLTQPQQISPSNIAPAPQNISVNTPHSQTMLQGNAPSQYYQDYPTNAISASSTLLDSEESGRSPVNNVKPLPRFIGEVDVPGEGPSWFYEDGTTCRKVIDGEPVNAQWGVTKAGKPRKRLAIACKTCREKKIKCDPAEPKCVQCEKCGRECIFTTA